MSSSPLSDLNTSLSSLALLSLQMGEGKDYLDYLHGFLVEAIHKIKANAFDSLNVQEAIRAEFGLRIPVATIAICLKRLQRENVLKPTSDGRQFQILKLPPTSIKEDRARTSGQINDVISQLKAFYATKYDGDWDDNQTASALTEFLREYSIDFVRFSEFRSPLPEIDSASKSDHFVVASFIKHCAEALPGVFDEVKTLVESHILANALLCEDLRDKGTGFKGVVFVLDTRLLLKAFDLESEIDSQNTRSLLEAIQKLKGILCVFPETKEEIRSVLQGIIYRYRHGGARGPVVDELRKRNRGAADVTLAEAHLEDNLRRLGISTLPSPAYDENTFRFQIDEAGLREELEEELGYSLGKAADHDVRAVRSILALRKGRRPSRIEDCGYVFMTTNSTLSRAAFNQQRAEIAGWIFSAVITDYHLSHLAWLKSPLEAGELARSEILSSCHAAMNPPRTIWRKYITEVDRLKSEGRFSEQDHEVLRLSLRAPQELMEITQGELEGITENNLRVILDRLESNYAAEKGELLNQEKLARKEVDAALFESERQRAELEEQERFLRLQKVSDEVELAKLRASESALTAQRNRQLLKFDAVATWISRLAFIALGVIFSVAVALPLFRQSEYKYGVPSAIFAFLSLLTGISGNSIREWVKKKVKEILVALTR